MVDCQRRRPSRSVLARKGSLWSSRRAATDPSIGDRARRDCDPHQCGAHRPRPCRAFCKQPRRCHLRRATTSMPTSAVGAAGITWSRSGQSTQRQHSDTSHSRTSGATRTVRSSSHLPSVCCEPGARGATAGFRRSPYGSRLSWCARRRTRLHVRRPVCSRE